MFKKTVTYTDYNGSERTEDFYFHLTQAELVEMQTSVNGGLDERLNRIIKAKDIPSIVSIVKEIVLKAYGEKSLDGRRFMKNQEITDNFAETEAYSIIFMELATDDAKCAEFMNAIVQGATPANKK